VFVALVRGTPSTVNEASAPCAACEKPKDGSLIVKGVVPSVLTIESCDPEEVVTTLAVTPRFCPLMLLARADGVSPSVVLMVVVVPPLAIVKLPAPNVCPLDNVGEVQEVPVVGAEAMEKSEAPPEAFAISESLAPVESLRTDAVTPRLALLMLEAKALSELLPPLPVVNVAADPEAVVKVKDEVGSVAVALDARSEYHEAVAARLLTVRVWVPVTVPVAADPVTALEFEDVTERDARGPVNELRESKSL